MLEGILGDEGIEVVEMVSDAMLVAVVVLDGFTWFDISRDVLGMMYDRTIL